MVWGEFLSPRETAETSHFPLRLTDPFLCALFTSVITTVLLLLLCSSSEMSAQRTHFEQPCYSLGWQPVSTDFPLLTRTRFFCHSRESTGLDRHFQTFKVSHRSPPSLLFSVIVMYTSFQFTTTMINKKANSILTFQNNSRLEYR